MAAEKTAEELAREEIDTCKRNIGRQAGKSGDWAFLRRRALVMRERAGQLEALEANLEGGSYAADVVGLVSELVRWE